MTTSRLEAFSDGVIAIIITIMVLELKAPDEYAWHALSQVVPLFVSYVISFVYVGSYWNHHHHLFHFLDHVSGKVLWSNLFFLFCLSLVPVATAWVGESHEEAVPVAFYGCVLLLLSFSFLILNWSGIRHNADKGQANILTLRDLIGSKAILSFSLYVLGIVAAFYYWQISAICYSIVLLLWLMPNEKIEA